MIDLLSISEILEKREKVYAHTSNGKSPELLAEHLELTMKYYDKLCNDKGIGDIVINTMRTLQNKDIPNNIVEFIYGMFINAIYLHDIGKINPAFQKKKMMNPLYSDSRGADSNHAALSSLIYLDLYIEKIKQMEHKELILQYLYSFSYAILRHHTHLINTNDFISKNIADAADNNFYESIVKNFDCMEIKFQQRRERNDWELDEIKFFILNKLLYALICTCDYYATYEYKNGKEIEFEHLVDVHGLYEKYTRSNVYQNIIAYKKCHDTFKDKPINALRSDIFIETEENLINNISSYIFYLEAPTGSGKTNTSINLALRLLENDKNLNNIFYIFPFNTLSEQTAQAFEEYFVKNKDFIVINSVTAIPVEDEDEAKDFDKRYMDYLLMHYPIVLTSHIRLFKALFGCGKEDSLMLTRLVNSVIIIDEIQSYRNDIWREIIIFLNKYAEVLNIKIIIMSATLPKLGRLISEEQTEGFVNLLNDPQKYYQDALFKNRVELDFTLLEKDDFEHEDLIQIIESYLGKRILVEFINKTTARNFYNKIKKSFPSNEIIELTGDDNKASRNNALKKIKEAESIIVVATQVIEAGVDIDLDIGFKDISILDSEEQFLGRINRSCMKEGCKAYFFNFDKAEKIYRKDKRLEFTLKVEWVKDVLLNKNFDSFYNKVLQRIHQSTEEYNANNISNIYKEALYLSYDEIEKKLNLINNNTFQLFLAYQQEVEGELLDGSLVWEQYKNLLNDKKKPYSQKKIEFSKLYEKMAYFSYNVFSDSEGKPGSYDEQIGSYFYISNGQEYIEDGKFDRGKYVKATQGRFLV